MGQRSRIATPHLQTHSVSVTNLFPLYTDISDPQFSSKQLEVVIIENLETDSAGH